MVCIIKLGNLVEGLIEVVTLGRGKDIATWVAGKLGYEDCGLVIVTGKQTIIFSFLF